MTRSTTLILAAAGLATATHADTLLEVDLSTVDQITITATSGLSDATINGSDTTGWYLADIFGAPATTFVDDDLVSGDLTAAANSSDGTPSLFTSTFTVGTGLNIFSVTDDPELSFTAGSQAFSGSATWTIDSVSYNNLVAGSPVGSTGTIFFPADTDDDIPDATALGTYRVVPTPGAATLVGFGLAGFAARRRR